MCSPRLPWLEVAKKKEQNVPLTRSELPAFMVTVACGHGIQIGQQNNHLLFSGVSVLSVLVLVYLISFQGHGDAWGRAAPATAARCQEELTDRFCPQRDSSSSDRGRSFLTSTPANLRRGLVLLSHHKGQGLMPSRAGGGMDGLSHPPEVPFLPIDHGPPQ